MLLLLAEDECSYTSLFSTANPIYLEKLCFSSYRPAKFFCPIRLQRSLNISISERNGSNFFYFNMKVSLKNASIRECYCSLGVVNMPGHVQIWPELPGMNWLVRGLCGYSENNSEWKINWILRKQKVWFCPLSHKLSNYCLKCVFVQSDCRTLWSSIFLEQNN